MSHIAHVLTRFLGFVVLKRTGCGRLNSLRYCNSKFVGHITDGFDPIPRWPDANGMRIQSVSGKTGPTETFKISCTYFPNFFMFER